MGSVYRGVERCGECASGGCREMWEVSSVGNMKCGGMSVSLTWIGFIVLTSKPDALLLSTLERTT